MPGVTDEVKWDKAKKIVEDQKGGTEDYWALVNHIYQNMGGEFTHESSQKLNEVIALCQFALKYPKLRFSKKFAFALSTARRKADEENVNLEESNPVTSDEITEVMSLITELYNIVTAKIQKMVGTLSESDIPDETLHDFIGQTSAIVNSVAQLSKPLRELKE